ncbi:hypothetical protein [Actinocorallia populi]|uniref:hypothetical protein n=1 Tax=Actinocorallia populi TaxID=2079200 RepID=UPI0018E50025|nr:hypothetical protein [Actinocorallia populi]
MDTDRTAPRPPLRHRSVLVLALLVLSPVCAEYLIGYLELVSRPVEMLVGLLVLAPLYGTVAVMIREVVRRTGRGWPAILLLSAAFGVVQAGLIDQSLFNPDFIDEPFWDEERLPTLLAGPDVSVNHALSFVAGHVIWSFAAPIAVVESCAPRYAGRPWSGRLGMSTMILLYALAVLVFFDEHTMEFMAAPAQLGASAVLALVLIAAAFAVPRRRVRRPGRVPSPWKVGGLGVILLTTFHALPPHWTGTVLKALLLVVCGGLLLRWSGRAGWGRVHVLAAAGSALVANAALSFVVEPVGEVSYPAKYAANATLLLGVLVLLAWARRRLLGAAAEAEAEAVANRPAEPSSEAPVPPAAGLTPPSAALSNGAGGGGDGQG